MDDYDDDDDVHDLHEAYLSKMPGLKKQLGALEEEEEEEGSEKGKWLSTLNIYVIRRAILDEFDSKAWGKKKSIYYDNDEEEEEISDEETEALRIQKERMASMKDSDFLDTFGDEMAAAGESVDSKIDVDLNEELDNIDFEWVPSLGTSIIDSYLFFFVSAEVEVLAKDFSSISKKEILDHLAAESPELMGLLAEFKEKTTEVIEHVQPILERLKSGNAPTCEGISFLELKNHLLLSYCMNLAFYFYLKADGRRVKDHPVIGKLVELRLYMDKMKPIEQKLKYQIDKLVKLAVTGEDLSAADPLSFKAHPSNFVLDENEEAGSKQSTTSKTKSNDDEDFANSSEEEASGLYRAPRIAPVPYDEEPDADARRRKAADRARQRAGSSRLMDDLMQEVVNMPEEVVDAGNMRVAGAKRDHEWEERIRAEEEMMVRLPVSRKDKKKMREQTKFTNELAGLDDFDDLSYMENLEVDQMADEKKKSLRNVIKGALDEDKPSKKQRKGGDDDLPYQDRKAHLYNKATAGEDYNQHLDEINASQSEQSEDDFYKEAVVEKQKRKEERKQAFKEAKLASSAFLEEDVTVEDGHKRLINYDILKNKGLTPARSKEQRNPRVKHRRKYEQSMKKLKSFKSVMKTQDKPYMGEQTGIKKNLARSVKFA